MNRELHHKFIDTLRKFAQENNLKMSDKEFIKIYRIYGESLNGRASDDHFGKDYDFEDEDFKDFRKLHDQIVQMSIDFINSHPKVKEKIEEKRKEVEEAWNKDLPEDCHLYPDVRMYFGVDSLDDSLENNEWVSSTDSYLQLTVGNSDVYLSA
jgi:hypothetical protein